jgi:hypothetical protein
VPRATTGLLKGPLFLRKSTYYQWRVLSFQFYSYVNSHLAVLTALSFLGVRKSSLFRFSIARIGDNISRYAHKFHLPATPASSIHHTTTSLIRPLATLIVAQHEVHADLDHLFHTRERDGIGGTVQSPMVASYLAVCCWWLCKLARETKIENHAILYSLIDYTQ